MVTRRSFLFGSLSGFLSLHELLTPSEAWAKHTKTKAKPSARQIVREDWPPAVAPDHIGVVDKNYCCFSDEFGRLSIVDLRKAPDTSSNVLAQLNNIGRKVIDFVISDQKAYALCTQEAEHGDFSFALVTISLAPVGAPSVVSHLAIDAYSEPTCLTASQGLVCIGGISNKQENLISIYKAPAGRGEQSQPNLVSSHITKFPIAKIDLQGRTLIALQTGMSSDGKNVSSVDFFSLVNPHSPAKKSITLDGQFNVLVANQRTLVVAGKKLSAAGCEAKSITLGSTPHITSTIALDPMIDVFDIANEKDDFLVLGSGKNGGLVVALNTDKNGMLSREQVIDLPENKGVYGPKSEVALRDRNAYVSAGSAGIQILTGGKGGWTASSIYTVPRMPVSSMACWENLLVLASADLKVLNISQPSRLNFTDSTDLSTPIKSIVGAGSYILCLGKDGVSLRKMDNLKTVLASVKNTGQNICFDKVKQVAYLLDSNDKKTSTQTLKVYSNSLALDKEFNLDGEWLDATADGGYLLLAGLHDIALYGITDSAESVGNRHFDDLAIREICLADEHVIATALDKNSKGFLLVLAKDQQDLLVQGTIELPTDGAALAVNGNKAVVAGQDKDGKDIASIIDFSTALNPKIISSWPTVEAASAVLIKNELGIIAGRGIEIVSLTS